MEPLPDIFLQEGLYIFSQLLYKKKYLVGFSLYFILLYPDLIVYSSLALRDILTLLFMSIGVILMINKKYLVFSKQGELPMIVTDLWEEIWGYFEKNSDYERAFEIDFEKFTDEDEIEIYVSIK